MLDDSVEGCVGPATRFPLVEKHAARVDVFNKNLAMGSGVGLFNGGPR